MSLKANLTLAAVVLAAGATWAVTSHNSKSGDQDVAQLRL